MFLLFQKCSPWKLVNDGNSGEGAIPSGPEEPAGRTRIEMHGRLISQP